MTVRHWGLVVRAAGAGTGTQAARMTVDSSLAAQSAVACHQKIGLDGLIDSSRDHAAKSRPNGSETAVYREASLSSVLGAIGRGI